MIIAVADLSSAWDANLSWQFHTDNCSSCTVTVAVSVSAFTSRVTNQGDEMRAQEKM